jgi:hypothetical protein
MGSGEQNVVNDDLAAGGVMAAGGEGAKRVHSERKICITAVGGGAPARRPEREGSETVFAVIRPEEGQFFPLVHGGRLFGGIRSGVSEMNRGSHCESPRSWMESSNEEWGR